MKQTKCFVMCVMLMLLLLMMGCESGALSLRFAPKEAQKQAAWLTADLAKEVEAKGTVPSSPAAKKLVQGTRAAALYMGLPKVPANPDEFDTIAPMAEQQAQERPDVWTLADNAFELGIGITALFGGTFGTVALQRLKKLRQKGKALEQIVKGNELFTKDENKDFKTAQSETQTVETKKLVAEIKATA